MSHITVDEEGTFAVSAQQPEYESSEASSLVDPRFHLFGCGMLFLLICSIFQCPSASSDAYIAAFCLICSLICFSLSAFSHWVFNSLGGDPCFLFRLDYMGIILHIWATSISVLVLEIEDNKIHGYGLSGLSLASLTAAFCLFFLPLGKKVRIAVICGLGSFAFLEVLSLVAAYSRPSRLSASYSAMVAMNCVGGWHYLRQSDRNVGNGLAEPSPAKGHTLMHICSMFASMIYGITLVQLVCTS